MSTSGNRSDAIGSVAPYNIRERGFLFALRAVRLYRFIHQREDRAAIVLGDQFLRSATSIGANLEEARSGQSRADFVHKLCVAQKEAREASYWLRLFAASGMIPWDRSSELRDESEQILRVISKIIVNTRNNASPKTDARGS